MERRNKEGGTEKEISILRIGRMKRAQQRDPHMLGSRSLLIAIPGQASHGTGAGMRLSWWHRRKPQSSCQVLLVLTPPACYFSHCECVCTHLKRVSTALHKLPLNKTDLKKNRQLYKEFIC